MSETMLFSSCLFSYPCHFARARHTPNRLKKKKISDNAIRVGELHLAGPVPDEGGYPTELEGTWESMARGLQSSYDEVGGQDER